jgi:hypothetical protein
MADGTANAAARSPSPRNSANHPIGVEAGKDLNRSSIGRTKAMFIWLIIRLIQLVFSAKTVFFSHKKSANSVFQPAYNSSRTAPKLFPSRIERLLG